MHVLPTLLAAVLLASVHLMAGKLRFLEGIPRSGWLSAAGGVSVAYVFVWLLPELAEAQTHLARAAEGLVPFLEHHVYVVALLGLAAFYGLERLAISSRRGRDGSDSAATSPGVFRTHIGAFAAYDLLIGYLVVHHRQSGPGGLALLATALALHFLVNDYSLREHHREAYRRYGRWVLAAAVLAGWAVAQVVEIDPAALAMLLGFLAGAVVLNVLKEELPAERESRFWTFAVSAALYTVLLLLAG